MIALRCFLIVLIGYIGFALAFFFILLAKCFLGVIENPSEDDKEWMATRKEHAVEYIIQIFLLALGWPSVLVWMQRKYEKETQNK